MRPGLGWSGLEHLQEFVRKGGLLITANDTTNFAVDVRLHARRQHRASARLKVTGSALRSKMVDAASPIVYGYQRQSGDLRLESAGIRVSSNMAGGGGGGRRGGPERARAAHRPRHGRRSGYSAGARLRPRSPKSRTPKSGRPRR